MCLPVCSKVMSTVKLNSKRLICLFIATIVVFCLFYQFSNHTGRLHRSFSELVLGMKKAEMSLTPVNAIRRLKTVEDIQNFWEEKSSCKQVPQAIEDIATVVGSWQSSESIASCRDLEKLFSSVYSVRLKSTTLKITDTFMTKVSKWLSNNKDLIEQTKKQNLIFVDNKYSQESVVFNPVRSKRPGASADGAKEFVKNLVEKSSKDCDFCNYKKFTGQDDFGILESKHAVIVSNAFKIEKFHGMALLRKHNPIDFNLEEHMDQMNLIGKWFKTAHALAPDHLYRHMYWDVFPKASASQIHPHIHLALANEMYYMKWERLHTAAEDFTSLNQGESYWNRLINVHFALKLGIRFGNAAAIVYLTPQKDNEVMVISPKPSVDFFQLTFCVIRAFYDDLELYAVSMGFVFPKLGTPTDKLSHELPAMVRILSRGPINSHRSDVSSFDLFGTPNVNKDPFSLAAALKKSIGSRCRESYKPEHWEWDE